MEAGQMPQIFINPAGKVCINNGRNGAELPQRLLSKLPAEVIEAAKAKAAERAAKEAAKQAAWLARREEHRATIESLRHRRCWVLGGCYMEDRTIQRYTLQELEDWRDWARYFQFKDPTVVVTALAEDGSVITSDDWSLHFKETCGERCPATEDMAKMAADLAAYTNERRGFHAQSN